MAVNCQWEKYTDHYEMVELECRASGCYSVSETSEYRKHLAQFKSFEDVGLMNIPDTLIETIVVSQGLSFDSHDIIRQFGHKNQRLYVKELAAINSDWPFQVLHAALGRQIKEVCERLGYKSEATRSLDIFGQHSECVRWEIFK